MTIGGDHPHFVRSQLPEHAIQNRPAFFSRYRKRGMRDQLLQIARSYPPTFVETDGGESRKFIPRQAKEFEPRSPAIERYPLFPNCSNFHRSGWQFTRNFAELLRRYCDSSSRIHIGHYLCANRNIQVCTRELDSLISCLKKNICQHRQCRFCRYARGYCG